MENGEYVLDENGKMKLDMVNPENKAFNEAFLKLKGQILQINNSRDAFGAAMYYLDIDVNNPTEKDWKNLYGLLAMQKEYVQGYVMDEIYNKMEKGESWIAAYYAGDCLSMMGENEDLSFFYPQNLDENGNYEYRTNIFADAMCIPYSEDRSEDSLTLAHMYIEFMLEPEIAYANAEYIYYGCPYDYSSNPEYEEYIYDYEINMGKYQLEVDSKGNPVEDEDGNYIVICDEHGNPLEDSEGDYFVIYNKEFENDLANMFKKYQYQDLTNINLKLDNGSTKSQLNILTEKWEKLKIESSSMVGVYVVCAVIAVIIVGFIVYVQIKKRRQRRLYWGNTPSAKSKKKEENPDLSETQVVAISKTKK
jgi:spermidine/putrescine-binding protein